MARKRQRKLKVKLVEPTLKRFMVDGHNPETGELEVPIINMWLTKDGGLKSNNVGGAARSGTEVEIIRRDADGWVYLECEIFYLNQTWPQKGYVRESLVKELGAFDNG